MSLFSCNIQNNSLQVFFTKNSFARFMISLFTPKGNYNVLATDYTTFTIGIYYFIKILLNSHTNN